MFGSLRFFRSSFLFHCRFSYRGFLCGYPCTSFLYGLSLFTRGSLGRGKHFFSSCSFLCQPFSEFLHAAHPIHEFILPGIKRVARRTYLHLNCCLGRAYFKHVPARAFYLCFLVISWMNILFHSMTTISYNFKEIKRWLGEN